MERSLLLLILSFISISEQFQTGSNHVSVKWNANIRNYEVVTPKSSPNGKVEVVDSVAWGTFKNAINQTGWSYLEVYTNGSYDDTQQAYAAGLTEAALTRDLIDMHWQNTYKGYCVHPMTVFCAKLQAYVDMNMAWVSHMIAQKAETDPYWHQVELFYERLAGLVDGVNGHKQFPAKYGIDVTTIAIFQISGDLEDLESAFGQEKSHMRGSGSCSSLIKLLPGNADLYVAQDTWNGFNSMLRILKKYDFPYRTTGEQKETVPAQVMTMSSYPGVLMSGDDFYIMDTGLVSIETTIGNNNPALWANINPTNSVLEGIRNMVANRLAKTGAEWVDLFLQFNSGTYNNDWMIVDYKLFKPGQPLPKFGLLNIAETLPGVTARKDVTALFVNQTYWPSYNIPYFPDIFTKGGNQESVKKYGDWFTYNNSPRAKIFRRDHTKVKDIESMTKLMRYNDYTRDPLSRCNCTPPYSGENAISARSDLNPASGRYPFSALGHRSHGGIDMKLTSSSMAQTQEFVAVSSPTYDNVPVFRWSTSPFKDSVSHIGHPDLWDFKPERHHWGSRA